jgi:protein-disulfide isomerase
MTWLAGPARHCHNCTIQLRKRRFRGLKAEEFQVSINRRELCQGAATVALAAALEISGLPLLPAMQPALADGPDGKVAPADLMKPQALPDMVMGNDKASVTVVEYASMTCPHCAHFQETTFPELKKRYIDTGKVRYIFREFPLDTLASAAFMLARCAGEKDQLKYFAMVDTLFRQQNAWVTAKPVPPLLVIAKQAGFTEQTFDTCLANQKLLDGIQNVRQTAIDTFKVQSTPTFFINGDRYAGALTIEQMAQAIDPQLKGG